MAYCHAEIYKWRDNSKVVQYTDILLSSAKQTSSHAEVLQVLHNNQAHDICKIEPTNGKISKKPSVYEANFFSFAKAAKQKLANNTPNNCLPFSNVVNAKAGSLLSFFGRKNNVVNQYSPLSANSFFNWGGKIITVFGQPIKVAENVKPKPSPVIAPASQASPPPVASAKTYYIAMNGNNNNPGTEAMPWRNLNHAVYALKAGETVLVKNGTYQESLNINKSGTAGKPITYKAYPGHKPKIEINKKELEGILIQGVSYINVEGFEVAYTAPGADIAKGEQTDNGIDISNAGNTLPHHINIKNNNIHGFPGGGIFTVLADYVTFEGNTIWQNALWAKWGNSGISMYQNVAFDQRAGYHMVIRSNTVYKNENKLPSFAIGSTTITDGNCIIIDDLRHTQKFLDNKTPYPVYKFSTLIENNICYDNGARGIHVYSSDNVLARHNTLYKNQRTASINDGELSAYDASNVRFVNNIVYAAPGKRANGIANTSNVVFERNLYFGTTDIANKSATDIIADPMFVSASINPVDANFSLKSGSPAVDKALAGQSPANDIKGKLRPQSIVPDVGAYESH